MLTTADALEDIQVIRTGTFLDGLSGIGGFPRGRITEIFGDEATGKSTICLQAIAYAQKQGHACVLADTEYSYTTIYGAGLGVDNKKLGLIRAQFAEEILDEIQEAVESGTYDLIVLDSVGGLSPQQEAEKSVGEKSIGAQASVVAKFCRKIVPLLSKHNVALVVINHSVMDIMSGRLTSSGGKKLAYHKKLSIRLKTKTNSALANGTNSYGKPNIVGKVIIGEVKKNALASTEGMMDEAPLLFGKGFSREAKMFEEALMRNIITKVGSTYMLGEIKLGVGLGKARQAIENSPELQKELTKRLEGE